MISSLKRALQPSVTDLKAEFKLPAGYEMLQAPAKLPTIFNGDKAVVYGIVRSNGDKTLDSAVEGTATLRGLILGKTIEYSIPFQITQPSEEETGPFTMPMVHHLAAKSLLKDWEAGEGVKQLKTPAKEAIIKLSIDSSVVSAHTAYVAVDEDQDKPIEGAIQTWDVTAMMAQQEMGRHGYRFGGGRGGGGGGALLSFTGGGRHLRKASPRRKKAKGSAFSTMAFSGPPPAAPMPMMSSFDSFGGPPPPPPGAMGGPPPSLPAKAQKMSLLASHFHPSEDVVEYAHHARASLHYRMMPESCSARNVRASEDVVKFAPESSSRQVTRAPSDKLSALISLQQAEGLWKLDASLAGVLSKSMPELEGACPVGCQGDVRQVWATVLALAYLEACLSGQREEWELVAMKAEFWLEGQSLPAGTTLQALREAAKKTV